MSSQTNALKEFGSASADSVKRTFAAHLPLYICALVFTTATIAVLAAYGVRAHLDASLFFLTTVPKYFAVGLFIGAVWQFFRLVRARSRSPLKDFGRWLYRGALSNDRPGNIFHTLVTITPLMIAFSALKETIPVIQPFVWDRTFEQWDSVLGFGYMPWEILQPVLGYPVVTWAINVAYGLWFVVMFGTLIWQAFFARPSTLRMQFLLAFSLSWFVAGNVLAVLFSSAGPCYYGFLISPDPYAAQMAYLHQVNEHWRVSALTIQDLLWQSYAASHGVNIGISAMPSMHVGVAVMMALVAWGTRRWLGIVYAAYAAIVGIGSVHLAWHYAVDGIAAIGLALVFWYIAGAFIRANVRLPFARAAVPVALPASQSD